MKKTRAKKIIKEEVYAKVCDKCQKEVQEDSFEDEISSFYHSFGFGTELDGTVIEFDLCKECLIKLLEDNNIKYRKTSYNI